MKPTPDEIKVPIEIPAGWDRFGGHRFGSEPFECFLILLFSNYWFLFVLGLVLILVSRLWLKQKKLRLILQILGWLFVLPWGLVLFALSCGVLLNPNDFWPSLKFFLEPLQNWRQLLATRVWCMQ